MPEAKVRPPAVPLTFALAGTFKAIQKAPERTNRAQSARWNRGTQNPGWWCGGGR